MEGMKVVSKNRRARHDYNILETLEAGVALAGTEVKSLRASRANLQDSYATVEKGEVWLHNAHISPYEKGNIFNLEPRRPRKLLLHRQQIRRLARQVIEKGITLVPLSIYFKRGLAKVELALAKGKRSYEKREAIRERDMRREMERESPP